MKPSPLFYLNAASAAAGISAILYFFSGPGSTSVSAPHEADRLGRIAISSAPVSSTSEPGATAYDFSSLQTELTGIENGRGLTYAAELNTVNSPHGDTRKLSAAVSTPRPQAQHLAEARLLAIGENRQEMRAGLDSIAGAESNDLPLIQPRPSISNSLYRGSIVAASNVHNQGQDNDSASVPSELKAVVLPAVMVPPSSEAGMTDLQKAEWRKLEQTFVADIGGAYQNPSDPEYRARWQSAQEISDAKFRQKFGTEAFLRYNTEAGRRSQ